MAYFEDVIEDYDRRIMRQGIHYIWEDQNLIPAPPDTHNSTAISAMMRDSLHNATKEWGAALPGDLIYSGVFVPSVLNSSSKGAVLDAVFPGGITAVMSERPVIQGTLGAAACFAHRPDRCANLGLTAEECADAEEVENRANENKIETRILVVEYWKGYLHLSLRSIYSECYTFPTVWEEVSILLGERGGTDKIKSMGYVEYVSQLRSYFNTFIQNALDKYENHTWDHFTRDDIRVAVLVGDASLKDVIPSAAGNGKIKILQEIDPMEVAPYEAAKFAFHTQDKTNIFGLSTTFWVFV
ncbi:hypothetical protein BS50DRAFT_640486 [Corynespora cassiicola Philippines]|uniref:Uncharacterized protein n=1 Tax=Corynespora cassiicola Philippines TaxID=1448308 RepID=A0A2T2N3U5_CORCC|nr:hypothetical protein BS50DRAFT_640486 [Corynespora cassiicola Philippines]